MKQTTNIYFLVDCSCAFNGESSQMAQKAIISALYFSLSQESNTEVSSPPEYANTTFIVSAFIKIPNAAILSIATFQTGIIVLYFSHCNKILPVQIL